MKGRVLTYDWCLEKVRSTLPDLQRISGTAQMVFEDLDALFQMSRRQMHLAPSHLRAGIQALEACTAHHPAGLALSTVTRVTPVSRDFSKIA